MTTTLQPGANTALPGDRVSVALFLPSEAQIDTSALLLAADGKVRGDGDMCFYNQPSVAGGALSMTTSANRADYVIDLSRVEPAVDKIVLTATVDGSQTFGQLSALKIDAAPAFTAEIPPGGRSEKALILG